MNPHNRRELQRGMATLQEAHWRLRRIKARLPERTELLLARVGLADVIATMRSILESEPPPQSTLTEVAITKITPAMLAEMGRMEKELGKALAGVKRRARKA